MGSTCPSIVQQCTDFTVEGVTPSRQEKASSAFFWPDQGWQSWLDQKRGRLWQMFVLRFCFAKKTIGLLISKQNTLWSNWLNPISGLILSCHFLRIEYWFLVKVLACSSNIIDMHISRISILEWLGDCEVLSITLLILLVSLFFFICNSFNPVLINFIFSSVKPLQL